MGYYADLIKEKQNKDDVEWITTKTGRHIPIEPGETKKEAIEKAFDKNKEKSKQEPSKSKIKGLDVKDQDGKQPEEGMWLFKPMSHNTFRGDIKLSLFKVKVRKKKSGESEAYLSTPNGLVTKGMSHVKGGKLFDSEEEARKYAESQKTPEEKEYDKKTTFEKVRDILEKQNPKQNDMNYYEKIIQEKQNSTFKYLGKSFVVNKDNYKYVKAQVEQTYKDRIAYLEEKKRSAQSTEKAAIETEIRDIKAGFKETLESLKWGAEWDNSKEEKDNDSVEDKFRYKDCLITIVKKSSGRYAFSITQNGHEEMSDQTYSTQDEAERGAKREVEEVWSSKDNSKSYYQSIIEKKNQIDPEKEMKKLQALKPVVEAFKHKGMTKHEVATRLMQEKNISETLAQQCVDSWY